MIELVFSLLLASPELEKKYEYCYKPNLCQMLSAVQYNAASIRGSVIANLPRSAEKFSCRFNVKITPSGNLQSVSMLECDERYSGYIFQAVSAAAPFQLIPEAYHLIKDINMTISPEY